MEHMRDLEQIQERDAEGAGRRLGTVVMAALVFIGLSTAVGVVLGRAARSEPVQTDLDPLASLASHHTADSANGGARGPSDDATTQAKRADLKVDKVALRFPNALTHQEERPEVLAALAAAAVEEAEVAGAPNGAGVALPSEATASASQQQGTPGLREMPEVAPAERIPAAMPASVTAGPAGRALARAAKYDPMVGAAIPQNPERSERARRGKEGDFNLQVASYTEEPPAKALAEGLRAKGHEAYVTRADIPERGVYYRVRIGPFESRWRANLYRDKFERREQMNTYVVRRPKKKQRSAPANGQQ